MFPYDFFRLVDIITYSAYIHTDVYMCVYIYASYYIE